MYACPACNTSAIPVYRALLNIGNMKHSCPHCQASLRMRRRPVDVVLLMAPLALASGLAYRLDVKSTPYVMFTFGLASVAGLSLWLNAVKFEVVDADKGFTPHGPSLRA